MKKIMAGNIYVVLKIFTSAFIPFVFALRFYAAGKEWYQDKRLLM